MNVKPATSRSARRVVVKLGTTQLVVNGRLNDDFIAHLAAQAAALRKQQVDVLFVTSGAIGIGFPLLGCGVRPVALPELQASAAVGQGLLMQRYQEHFARHGLVVGQVLLTQGTVHDRERYLNARNTIGALLNAGAVPIINENDTVSTEEIRFGDNDRLSALVATLADADLLVLLTDVDGLRRTDDTGAVLSGDENLLTDITRIDADITRHAGSGSALGTGGMASKVEAARIATASGATVVIANGQEPEVVLRVIAGERLGTRFAARSDRIASKKHWIAYGRRVSGKLVVDGGAQRALVEHKRSLLAKGVTASEGDFERGETIGIVGPDGVEFARGICNYSREQVERIKGRHTDDLPAALGAECYEEVVHRDNLVII